MGQEFIKNIQPIRFRSDLNFLRAVSVLAVIIYHIDKAYLPGGWLGVDIFFFISGYLLSNKIIVDLNKNNFKFKNFYINRIKRILPALFSSLIFTTPFAYYLLPPKELYLYLNSFQSTLLFYSNIFFQNLDFYDSPNAKFFPLLHMWSLSIEEQYYIVFPVILFLVYKFKKNSLFYFLSFIGIVSIALNMLDFGNIIFYQLQFRIWEFLFGVIFMFLDSRIEFNNKSKELGLFVIFISFLFFDDSMLNIFYTKFIILIGVILYVAKSEESKLVNSLNRNKFIQQTGLMSFSLYLFHQPIYVFFRVYDLKIFDVSTYAYVPLTLILFVISYLNWKFVEAPFQKNFTKVKKIVLGTVFSLLLVSVFTFLNEDSFINKFTNIPSKALMLTFKNQDNISQNGTDCENRAIRNLCTFEVPNSNEHIYVIGDSSFRTLSTAILELQDEKQFNLTHFGGDNCIYLLEVKASEISCPNKSTDQMDEFVKNIKNSIIIYGGRIPRYLTGVGFNNSFVAEDNDITVISNFDKKIIETIEFLSVNNKVILIYPIPEQGWNVPELYFYGKFEWGETISYPSSVWYERVKSSNSLLNEVKSENILRVYPEKIFCDSYLKNQCVGATEDKIFYSDDDHLSLEGARLVVYEIFKQLDFDK